MIVRPDGSDLLLVTQPDHAALSGRIMAAWRRDGFPSYPARAPVLLATREHDNGWIEVDRAPMLDPSSGRPFDFVGLPEELKQPIWPRAAARVGAMSPLAGALVAQHALTVLSRHRAESSWQPFFTAMEEERRRLRPPDFPQAALDDHYRFVYLGDLLSLVFCNGWTESFDAYDYRCTLIGSRLRIRPDPFAGREVVLEVPARRIPAPRYSSEAELMDAFARAEMTSLTGFAAGEG